VLRHGSCLRLGRPVVRRRYHRRLPSGGLRRPNSSPLHRPAKQRVHSGLLRRADRPDSLAALGFRGSPAHAVSRVRLSSRASSAKNPRRGALRTRPVAPRLNRLRLNCWPSNNFMTGGWLSKREYSSTAIEGTLPNHPAPPALLPVQPMAESPISAAWSRSPWNRKKSPREPRQPRRSPQSVFRFLPLDPNSRNRKKRTARVNARPIGSEERGSDSTGIGVEQRWPSIAQRAMLPLVSATPKHHKVRASSSGASSI
jgi:hypothetical protein